MNELHLTALNLRSAAEELVRATHELRRSAQVLADVEFELENAEAAALVAGVDGGNEAQRKANLRMQFAAQHAAVKAARDGHADARRDLEVAQIREGALRSQLRLQEVAAVAK